MAARATGPKPQRGSSALVEAVLELDDRDAGCDATRSALERYVEAELRGEDAADRFPGVAVHLAVCPACRTDHDGVLALTRLTGEQRDDVRAGRDRCRNRARLLLPGPDYRVRRMPDEPVLTERRDGVLLITLNRPEARNAFNLALSEAVAAALDALDDDGDLRVGVLTGAGRGFSAGMDLKAFVAGERPYIEGRGFAGIIQRSARKPVIAAVEGFAVAGGLEVALACDLIVAAKGAQLGIPEVKRGLVAAGGALLRLPQRTSYGAAMELALTGDPITAERAYELGVVNRLTEPGAAVDAALALAAAIARNAPLALETSKAVLRQQFDWGEDEFWARQGELVGPIFASEDAREGAVAFAEKREPVWRRR
jgi:enoyl-CoA hydratase/carnithine racemase